MNDTELIAATDSIQAVIDTATRAADPAELDAATRFHSVVTPAGGEHHVVDVDRLAWQLQQERAKTLDRPQRKTGVYRVHNAASFLAFVEKHGDEGTEIWADTTTATVTGVLNAHETSENNENSARWEDHRVVFAVIQTDAWKAWLAHDGKYLSQQDFAEHLEDRAIDVVEPSAADLLELAQTFKATIGVNFESSKRLSSGEAQLEYRETVDARAGKAGQMAIPETFKIAVRPFEGADLFGVTVRLRYRIADGALRLGYRLDRPTDVMREAFLGVVEAIDEGLEQPVLRGSR